MLKLTNILKCPYCDAKLNLVKSFRNDKQLGIYKCDCDEYPIVENLIILVKDDSQINKRIIRNLAKKNIYALIWICLAGVKMSQRVIIFITFFLSRYSGIKIPQKNLFKLLKILSPNKAWFNYLVNREKAEDFKFASKTLGNSIGKGLILDIGCGTGQFINKIDINLTRGDLIIGIDKSIISLLIAKMYTKSKDVFFILSDLEQGIPLQDTKVDKAILLNSFPWIYNKKRICKETARILKNEGKLYMFNIFAPVGKAKYWGDGIFPKKLKVILNENFTEIRLMNYNKKNNERIDDYGYSVLAVKK